MKEGEEGKWLPFGNWEGRGEAGGTSLCLSDFGQRNIGNDKETHSNNILMLGDALRGRKLFQKAALWRKKTESTKLSLTVAIYVFLKRQFNCFVIHVPLHEGIKVICCLSNSFHHDRLKQMSAPSSSSPSANHGHHATPCHRVMPQTQALPEHFNLLTLFWIGDKEVSPAEGRVGGRQARVWWFFSFINKVNTWNSFLAFQP